jgi:hypothetical protein
MILLVRRPKKPKENKILAEKHAREKLLCGIEKAAK